MTSARNAMSVLSAQISSTLQQSMQQRRAYTEGLEERTVKNGACQGFIELDGSGEAIATVKFPMAFLERPVFSPGLEIGANNWVEFGDFPLWSATVIEWTRADVSNAAMYVAATLGIVIIGADGRYSLHFEFKGQSFTNPTGSNPMGSSL